MKRFFCLYVVALLFFSCSSQPRKPRLVVFISVDQLVPDLLGKYEPLFTGGYHWLREHGKDYTHLYHEHGYTTTGAGHFTLVSGRYPGPVGIIGNSWYDRKTKQSIYCAQDSLSRLVTRNEPGKSYRFVSATALGDWLKAAEPKAKVYSVALKDRASVMLGGKHPDLVLWFDPKDGFTTSDYYHENLPMWVKKFNREMNLTSYRDSVWARTLDEDIYLQFSRPDSFPGEIDLSDNGVYDPVLPFKFDSSLSDEAVYDMVGNTPWGDRITLELAETCIRANRMGKDRIPDLMFISLSANDRIGHNSGPYSQEMMDNLLKTDQALMDLIQFVESYVGSGKTLYVLTADHGAGMIPEYRQYLGLKGGRINRPLIRGKMEAALKEIQDTFGEPLATPFLKFVYYNHDRLSALGIPSEALTKIIQSHLKGVEGLRAVVTKEELLTGQFKDPVFTRMQHMIHPEKSADLWLLEEEGWTFRWPQGGKHGTPYNYDSHVPLCFSAPDWSPERIDEPHASIDIAPTLAKLLCVSIPSRVDGEAMELSF